MSKLAEDLESAFKADNDLTSVLERITGKTTNKVPGYDAFSRHSHGAAVTLLRSARFHFAGAAPWKCGDDAIQATTIKLQAGVLSFQTKMLSCGILVGQTPQWQDCKDYSETINDSDFKFRVDLQSLQIAMDHKALGQIAEQIAGSVAGAAEASGFRQSTDKETLHVWDIWYAALGNSSMSMYETGVHLGRKWYEEEVLNGIAQASQSEARE